MTKIVTEAALSIANVEELRDQLTNAKYVDLTHFLLLHNASSTQEERRLVGGAISSVIGTCVHTHGKFELFSGDYVLYTLRMYPNGWEADYATCGDADYASKLIREGNSVRTMFFPIFVRRYANREDESND